MKDKKMFFILGCMFFLALISPITATDSATCNLDVVLINQDPDPVLPGDYVELVFQLSGIENYACQGASFEIIPNYPFSLDPNNPARANLAGRSFVSNFKTVWNIPYRLRVDKDALEGENKIEVKYSPGNSLSGAFSKSFNITVEDVRVDFELAIKNYDKSSSVATFEILNTGEHDIEALTIEINEQDNIKISGSPRVIVGSLDSNEETTFDLKTKLYEGDVNLRILYTDEINERRSVMKTVNFNPDYYPDSSESSLSIWFYLFIILLLIVAGRWYWKRRKTKKRQ